MGFILHFTLYIKNTTEPQICTYTVYVWVNYNISVTWIKAIWGWFPLLTMIPGEAVIIYGHRHNYGNKKRFGMGR